MLLCTKKFMRYLEFCNKFLQQQKVSENLNASWTSASIEKSQHKDIMCCKGCDNLKDRINTDFVPILRQS